MNGVAPGRLAGTKFPGRDPNQAGQPAHARPKLAARIFADQLATLVRVRAREQAIERNLRVSVYRVTIRERKLGALGGDVDELGLAQHRHVEALEQGELLQT